MCGEGAGVKESSEPLCSPIKFVHPIDKRTTNGNLKGKESRGGRGRGV